MIKEKQKKVKKKSLQEKGITLIVLVVTIVVLLILAGVSINLVLGDNGIVNKSRDARDKTAEASQNDLTGMNDLIDEMNSALGEKKSVDIKKLKIGDYVNYTYDDANDYILSSTYSGYSDQTIAQTKNLKWRILNIDEIAGTVDLISEYPTSSKVGFKGTLGYNNGPYLMNEICKAQYSNSILDVKARSINLLDMEKQLTEDKGILERNKYSADGGARYGRTVTYDEQLWNTAYPSLYVSQKGAGVNVTTENDSSIMQPDISKGNDPYEESKAIAEKEPTTDDMYEIANTLTVTQTYYFIDINNSNYGEAAKVLNNSNWWKNEHYWIASRYVDTYNDYNNNPGPAVACWGLRLATTCIDGYGLFDSNRGLSASKTYGFRPIVSLSSSIISNVKDASGAWNLK